MVSVRRALALAACLLGAAGVAGAGALRDIASGPVPTNLACLQSSLPVALAPSGREEGPAKLLRARLTFSKADAPPIVDWLWKGDEAAAAQLETSLLRYRMPCLNTSLGAQNVVQEFWVAPGTGALEASAVWSAGVSASKESCYWAPNPAQDRRRELPVLSKALVYFRFVEGAVEPEVEVGHHTGSSFVIDRALRKASEFRRCPDGRTSANWHEVVLMYRPAKQAPVAFKSFDLAEFLSLAKNPQALRAHFDLATMKCPFDVKYTVNQPAARNRARSVDEVDDNRTGFLDWLGGLQLDISSDAEAAFFGETLTVHVPCLLMNLKPSV